MSIYMCFRGPNACRDGGNVDLRVNRGHEHVDLHVIYTCFKGPKTCRRLVGWLAVGTPIYV